MPECCRLIFINGTTTEKLMGRAKPKLNASANQLILNCRIDEHSNNKYENNNEQKKEMIAKLCTDFILRFCFFVFCFLFFIFGMRKHQKLHKRAEQPKTYDSRGRHLSDYNNSNKSVWYSNGIEAT